MWIAFFLLLNLKKIVQGNEYNNIKIPEGLLYEVLFSFVSLALPIVPHFLGKGYSLTLSDGEFTYKESAAEALKIPQPSNTVVP